MLTITAALPWEAQTARGGQAIAGRGRVRLLTSGVGPLRARDAADALLDSAEPVTAVLSIGVAGGLTNHLRRPMLTIPHEIIRRADGARFTPDPALRKQLGRLLNEADLPWQTAASITTPTVLFTRAEKLAAAETGAEIVQMEDAEWAELCAAAGVPFATLRVVMDALDDDIPTEVTGWRGRPTPLQLATAAVQRWQLLPELAGLALQRRAALLQLERALTILLPALAPAKAAPEEPAFAVAD